MGHTPGPWNVHYTDGESVFVKADKRVIALALMPVGADPGANAKLIAAAPELLAELKLALEYVEAASMRGNEAADADLERIAAVIAAAEGKA